MCKMAVLWEVVGGEAGWGESLLQLRGKADQWCDEEKPRTTGVRLGPRSNDSDEVRYLGDTFFSFLGQQYFISRRCAIEVLCVC